MALPVLDGNQTATTLSSVVTGGEHIVAHSVVSLGANAIANITSAVSGSVVSVSNFPASQSTTFGAVTGSISVLNFPSTQTVAGTVTANVSSIFGETDQSQFATNFGDNFAQGVLNFGSLAVSQQGPISGTVTVGNSVTIGSLPAISGTVTVGVMPEVILGTSAVYDSGDDSLNVNIKNIGGGSALSASSSFPVSGTVTIGGPLNADLSAVAVALHPADINGNTIFSEAGSSNPFQGIKPIYHTDITDNGLAGEVKESSGLPIRGSIGEFTTRFGSVVTANTAFATSAVTNASRKYLLIQNVTTGSNAITVGIGFTPTTTRGIQLTAGAGITFESSFIPTGAVYVLSSVTASNFTILEG